MSNELRSTLKYDKKDLKEKTEFAQQIVDSLPDLDESDSEFQESLLKNALSSIEFPEEETRLFTYSHEKVSNEASTSLSGFSKSFSEEFPMDASKETKNLSGKKKIFIKVPKKKTTQKEMKIKNGKNIETKKIFEKKEIKKVKGKQRISENRTYIKKEIGVAHSSIPIPALTPPNSSEQKQIKIEPISFQETMKLDSSNFLISCTSPQNQSVTSTIPMPINRPVTKSFPNPSTSSGCSQTPTFFPNYPTHQYSENTSTLFQPRTPKYDNQNNLNICQKPSELNRSSQQYTQTDVQQIQLYLKRLLHSQSCPSNIGCNEHCTFMKRVLLHLKNCDRKTCVDLHCHTSRKIILHYQRCELPTCQLCAPFRTHPQVCTPTIQKIEQVYHQQFGFSSASMHLQGWRAKFRTKENYTRVLSTIVNVLKDCMPEFSLDRLVFTGQRLEQNIFVLASNEHEYLEILKNKLLQLEESKATQRRFSRSDNYSNQNMQPLPFPRAGCFSPNVNAAIQHSSILPSLSSSCSTTIQQELSCSSERNNNSSSDVHTMQEFNNSNENFPSSSRLMDQTQVIRLIQHVLLKKRTGQLLTPLEEEVYEQVRQKHLEQTNKDDFNLKMSGKIATNTIQDEGRTLSKNETEPTHVKNTLPDIIHRYTPSDVKAHLKGMHVTMMQLADAGPFNQPVDPVLLKIPDYFNIIKFPMDFGTILTKLENMSYVDHLDYCSDVYQVFKNAWIYNSKNSKVYKMCSNMSKHFEKEITSILEELGYCCNGKSIEYKPTPIFCCSIQCQYSSIPRLHQYYVTKDEPSYSVCMKCYTSSYTSVTVVHEYDTNHTIPKDNFIFKVNDAVEYEPYISCSGCGMKCHAICLLYNKLIDRMVYCKKCIEEKNIDVSKNRVSVDSFPKTKLSDFLEEHLRVLLSQCDSPSVSVRVLCNINKKNEVSAAMKKRYPDYPKYFPFRHKAIFCFQKIDGVDVCFFGMHVQEYGPDAPEPNKNRVYISYLDSVYYFQPSKYRTLIYHEILMRYLQYCAELGYTYGHIWACPPAQGDDYIFYCHPEDQKVPKPKRLQEWYRTMLVSAAKKKCILSFRNIEEQKEIDNVVSVTQIPYLSGDYWPEIFEQQIVKLEEEKTNEPIFKKATTSNKSKKSKGGVKKKINQPKLLERQNSKLTEIVFDFMHRNKDVFFTVDLNEKGVSKVVQDFDPIVKCELMDGRESFLDVARENHYQFNTLRHAKFSSMMMLFHLKNSNGNMESEFTCNTCNFKISTVDPRYHCVEGCEDYDMCKKCYDMKGHHHKMNLIGLIIEDEESLDEQASSKSSRKKNEFLHKTRMQRVLKTALHSCTCVDFDCKDDYCKKMKPLIVHSRQCQQTPKCLTCTHLFSLAMFHIQTCTSPPREVCPFPFCNQIKLRLIQRKNNLKFTRMMKRRRLKEQHSATSSSLTPEGLVNVRDRPGSINQHGSKSYKRNSNYQNDRYFQYPLQLETPKEIYLKTLRTEGEQKEVIAEQQQHILMSHQYCFENSQGQYQSMHPPYHHSQVQHPPEAHQTCNIHQQHHMQHQGLAHQSQNHYQQPLNITPTGEIKNMDPNSWMNVREKSRTVEPGYVDFEMLNRGDILKHFQTLSLVLNQIKQKLQYNITTPSSTLSSFVREEKLKNITLCMQQVERVVAGLKALRSDEEIPVILKAMMTDLMALFNRSPRSGSQSEIMGGMAKGETRAHILPSPSERCRESIDKSQNVNENQDNENTQLGIKRKRMEETESEISDRCSNSPSLGSNW